MRTAGAHAGLVALAVIIATPVDARAQEWLHLDPLRGEVFLEFDGFWRDTEGVSSRDLELTEGLFVRQSGYVLDPRIATFSLDVRPEFSQQDINNSDAPDDNLTANNLSYNGSLGLLQGSISPVGLTAAAGRNTGEVDGDLGSRSEFEVDYRDVALNWKNRAFPTTLKYSERRQDRTFRSGLTGSASDQDDFLRSLQLTGRSRKLNLLLQRDVFDDDTVRNNDYNTNRGRLSHRLDWGKGSRLATNVDYFDRHGFNETESLTVDETLRLQHLSNLSSSAAYRFRSTDQETNQTTEHDASYGLTHRLYQNLTTTLNVATRFTDSDVTSEDEYRGDLRLAYGKEISPGIKLSLSGGGGYKVTDVESENGLASIVNEVHVIPVSLRFNLNNRFVDQPSIQVFNAKCPGTVCILDDGATPNPDYRVNSVANDLTEIEILTTGSSGLVAGDTVQVSYDFQPLPSIKFSTTNYDYNVRVDFGWIALFHRRTASHEDRISGADREFLTDRSDMTTGLEMRWTRPATRATFLAEYRSIDSGDFESDSLNFNQSVFHTLAPRADLNFSASEVFSDGDGTNSELYTADLSLSWRPWPDVALSVVPNLGAWVRRDKTENTIGTRDERFLSAGLDLRWAWRNVVVDLRYDHNHREGDDNVTDSDEDRVFLRVSRSF